MIAIFAGENRLLPRLTLSPSNLRSLHVLKRTFRRYTRALLSFTRITAGPFRSFEKFDRIRRVKAPNQVRFIDRAKSIW